MAIADVHKVFSKKGSYTGSRVLVHHYLQSFKYKPHCI